MIYFPALLDSTQNLIFQVPSEHPEHQVLAGSIFLFCYNNIKNLFSSKYVGRKGSSYHSQHVSLAFYVVLVFPVVLFRYSSHSLRNFFCGKNGLFLFHWKGGILLFVTLLFLEGDGTYFSIRQQ